MHREESGTNTAHGSGYEYLRSSGLDAKNFFANRSGIPLGSFRRDQFRGAFGAPAALPKVYDGWNRTFFLVSYEGRWQLLRPYPHSRRPAAGELPTPANPVHPALGLRFEKRFSSGVIEGPLPTSGEAGGDGRIVLSRQ